MVKLDRGVGGKPRTAVPGVAAIVAATVVLCFAHLPAFTASPAGSRAQAEALFEKARAAYDIRAEGSKPFRLVATDRETGPAGNVILGTITLIWAAPDRWRQEVKVGDSTEIQIRAGSKRARIGRGPWGAREAFVRRNLVEGCEIRSKFVLLPSVQASFEAGKPEGTPPTADVILHSSGGASDLGYRFDTSTGALVRQDSSGGETSVFENESRDGKLLPVTIKRFVRERQTSLWGLMEYSEVDDPDPALFAFPEGAVVWDACASLAQPKLVNRVNPKYPAQAAAIGAGGRVVLIVLLGPDGRVDDTYVAQSAGALFDRASLAAVKKWVFQIPPCLDRQCPIDWPITINFKPTRS